MSAHVPWWSNQLARGYREQCRRWGCGTDNEFKELKTYVGNNSSIWSIPGPCAFIGCPVCDRGRECLGIRGERVPWGLENITPCASQAPKNTSGKGSWWGPKGSSQVEGKEARGGGPRGGEARHQAQLLPLAWSHWLAPLICSLGSEGQTGIEHEEKSGEKQADLGPSPSPDTSPLRLWANRVTCLNPIFLLGPHGKGTPLHLLPGLLGGSAERTLRTHLQNMNLRV